MANIVDWPSRATRILTYNEDVHLNSGCPAVLICESEGATHEQPDDGLRLFSLRPHTRPGFFLLQILSPASATERAGDLVELSSPPANVVALIGPSDLLKQVSEWWASVSGNTLPALIPADDAESHGLDWRRLVEAIANSLHAGQIREAANLGAICALRSENEHLRRAVDAMGMALSAGGLPKSSLRYEAAAAPLFLSLEAQAPFHESIDLPASETSAIALKVASFSDGAGNDAYLRVTLTTIESGFVLGAWGIPFAQLKRDWIVLDLPRPVRELLETLLVEVAVVGDAGSKAELALSERRSLSAVLESSSANVEHGLALRVYSASAGRFVLPDFFLWEHAHTNLDDRVLFALPEEAWERVRVLDSRGDIAINPERGLRVFKPHRGVVSVRIPNIRVPALDQLITTARMVGDRAGSIEVAVLVVRSDAMDAGVAELLGSTACIGFSQWKVLNSSISEITVGAVVPPNAGFDLVLAARTPPQNAVDSVGVQWDEVRLGRANVPRPEMAAASADAAPLQRATASVSQSISQSVPFCVPGRTIIRKEEILSENYRHIAVQVQNLNFEDRFWKTLTLKVQQIDGKAGLEFRSHDGNAPFVKWPSAHADQFGPLFALREEVSARDEAQHLEDIAGLDPADRRFLRDFVFRLPNWLELAIIQADRAKFSGTPGWVAVARRLSDCVDALLPQQALPQKIAQLSA